MVAQAGAGKCPQSPVVHEVSPEPRGPGSGRRPPRRGGVMREKGLSRALAPWEGPVWIAAMPCTRVPDTPSSSWPREGVDGTNQALQAGPGLGLPPRPWSWAQA